MLQASEEVDVDASDAQSIDLDFNDFLESDRSQQPIVHVASTPAPPVWSGEVSAKIYLHRTPLLTRKPGHFLAQDAVCKRSTDCCEG